MTTGRINQVTVASPLVEASEFKNNLLGTHLQKVSNASAFDGGLSTSIRLGSLAVTVRLHTQATEHRRR